MPKSKPFHWTPGAIIAGAIAVWATVAACGDAAAAGNVVNCEGRSRQAVRQCCEAIVRANGLPDWMRLQWLDCRMVVSCAPRKNTGNYCRVQLRPLALDQEFSGEGMGGR